MQKTSNGCSFEKRSPEARQDRFLCSTFPHMLRDTLYRHRRRRQGEPVRCLRAAADFASGGPGPGPFHPHSAAVNGIPVGSLCFMHEILMLATSTGEYERT